MVDQCWRQFGGVARTRIDLVMIPTNVAVITPDGAISYGIRDEALIKTLLPVSQYSTTMEPIFLLPGHLVAGAPFREIFSGVHTARPEGCERSEHPSSIIHTVRPDEGPS